MQTVKSFEVMNHADFTVKANFELETERYDSSMESQLTRNLSGILHSDSTVDNP